MKNRLIQATVLALSLLVVGCAQFVEEPAGGTVISYPVTLLGADHPAAARCADYECKEDDALDTEGCIGARDCLDLALRDFSTEYPGERGKQRRNEIQKRLMDMSIRRCGLYKEHLRQAGKDLLRQIDVDADFPPGGLMTVSGDAGAIVTAEDIVRARVEPGCTVGDVRPEFKEAYLINLAIRVITGGIDSRRKEIEQEIDARRERDPTNYTVQAAIGDAIRHHGACTVMAGLAQAGDAIRKWEDPGLEVMDKPHPQGTSEVDRLSKDSPTCSESLLVAELFLDNQDIGDRLEKYLKRQSAELKIDGNSGNFAVAKELDAIAEKTTAEGKPYLSEIQSKYDAYVKGLRAKATENTHLATEIRTRQRSRQPAPGDDGELKRIKRESRDWLTRHGKIEAEISRILHAAGDPIATVDSIKTIENLYRSLLEAIPSISM
uniref:Uncharacterized protein n=1 Tax=Candidatus Kentrum sp. LFY TaxID=2126342 RepID=A0A450X009_9GAMM|nr:MAG: hypothetical protein BECKLFY1418C_GA0070996_11233 [Candidatus Kentron sp. LFY]